VVGALLLTLGGFAIAYLMRPLGAVLFTIREKVTVAVVAPGSACATELAMTEHAGATAAVTTAATNRVRVRMLGICRQGLTSITATRAGKRALLKIAIRRPQPAARRI